MNRLCCCFACLSSKWSWLALITDEPHGILSFSLWTLSVLCSLSRASPRYPYPLYALQSVSVPLLASLFCCSPSAWLKHTLQIPFHRRSGNLASPRGFEKDIFARNTKTVGFLRVTEVPLSWQAFSFFFMINILSF